MPMGTDDMSQYFGVALQEGCSQADGLDEHICQTPLQLQPSQAQPAADAVTTNGSAQTLLEPDEAMCLAGLHDQAQAAKLQPGFIHQSLLRCARGNKLPANTPLYGLFRTRQEGQMLMVYGTSLLNTELVTAFPSCCLVTQTYQAQSTHAYFNAC